MCARFASSTDSWLVMLTSGIRRCSRFLVLGFYFPHRAIRLVGFMVFLLIFSPTNGVSDGGVVSLRSRVATDRGLTGGGAKALSPRGGIGTRFQFSHVTGDFFYLRDRVVCNSPMRAFRPCCQKCVGIT